MLVGIRVRQRAQRSGCQFHQDQPVGAASLLQGHNPLAVRVHVGKDEPLPPGDARHIAVGIDAVEVGIDAVAVRQLELGEDHSPVRSPGERGRAVGSGEPALFAVRQASQAQMCIRAPIGAREGEAVAVRRDPGMERFARPTGEGFPGGNRLQGGERIRECPVLAGHDRAPLLPRPREGDAESRARGGVDPVRYQLARHLLHELAHTFAVRALQQVVEELRPVDVGSLARGPHRAPAGNHGQGLKTVFQHAGTQHHVLPGSVDAARVGQRRLVVGGDPFGEPCGCGTPREEGPGGRVSAKHATQHPAEQTGGVEVKHVNQLVRDHELHPVVEVGERTSVGGWACKQGYAVAGDDVGEPVRVVGMVRKHDVDGTGRRRPEGRGQLRVGPLRPVGKPGRQRMEGVGESDPEVLGVQRAPVLVRGHLGDGWRGCQERSGQEQEQGERSCQGATAVVTLVRDTAHTGYHRIMESKTNIWYRLGYAWETARLGATPGNDGRPGGKRAPVRSGNGSEPGDVRKLASSLPWQNLLREAGGLARRAAGERVGRVPVRVDVLRATLAGAGAALATRSLGALREGDAPPIDDPGPGLELMQGAGHGLALAVLTRHLPGGRLLRIALCSAAGYAAAPRGGLARVLRPITPATIRALSSLAPANGRERGLLEHAAFAAAFVLLYRPTGRGTRGRSSRHALPGV